MLNGYEEAQKIDKEIMKIHKQLTVNSDDTQTLGERLQFNTQQKRELIKFLRTVETTCIILQKETEGFKT